MARIRTSAALAGSFLVLGAFVAGPARADAPEVYLGNAAGRALDVSILGQHATFGVATAKVASDLTAKADGAGQLAAGVVSFTGNTSAATTGKKGLSATARRKATSGARQIVASNSQPPASSVFSGFGLRRVVFSASPRS